MSEPVRNFQTKEELIEAVNEIPLEIKREGFGRNTNGNYWINGPHDSKPKLWIARVQVEHGLITKILR